MWYGFSQSLEIPSLQSVLCEFLIKSKGTKFPPQQEMLTTQFSEPNKGSVQCWQYEYPMEVIGLDLQVLSCFSTMHEFYTALSSAVKENSLAGHEDFTKMSVASFRSWKIHLSVFYTWQTKAGTESSKLPDLKTALILIYLCEAYIKSTKKSWLCAFWNVWCLS